MNQPLLPDSSFPPAIKAPCYCRSDLPFGECCGAPTDDRSPPMGIVTKENFLTPEQCAELVHLIEQKEVMPFRVRDRDNNIHPDPTRVCKWIKMEDSQHVLDDLVARALEEQVVPVTGVSVEFYEEPQLLKYTPGGFYKYHTDNGYLVPGQMGWRKAVDRDISLLIYLSDDFEGGELHFKRLN